MSKKEQLLECNNKSHDAFVDSILNYQNKNEYGFNNAITRMTEIDGMEEYLMGNQYSAFEVRVEELTAQHACSEEGFRESFENNNILELVRCAGISRMISEQVINEMFVD